VEIGEVLGAAKADQVLTVTEAVEVVTDPRCLKPPAIRVIKNARFHFAQPATSQYIAMIVFEVVAEKEVIEVTEADRLHLPLPGPKP